MAYRGFPEDSTAAADWERRSLCFRLFSSREQIVPWRGITASSGAVGTCPPLDVWYIGILRQLVLKSKVFFHIDDAYNTCWSWRFRNLYVLVNTLGWQCYNVGAVFDWTIVYSTFLVWARIIPCIRQGDTLDIGKLGICLVVCYNE